MRWFVYISFGGQKIILIVVLCAAMPLSFSSGCPHGTLPTHTLPFSLWSETHTLPFSLWSEGVILSVNSHGDVIGRLETHVSLFPYWWIARFWIRRYRWMYILINLIIPTADVLKALNGRVSSKWRRMMKREDIFVSLTFQVSQSHFPFLGSAI